METGTIVQEDNYINFHEDINNGDISMSLGENILFTSALREVYSQLLWMPYNKLAGGHMIRIQNKEEVYPKRMPLLEFYNLEKYLEDKEDE